MGFLGPRNKVPQTYVVAENIYSLWFWRPEPGIIVWAGLHSELRGFGEAGFWRPNTTPVSASIPTRSHFSLLIYFMGMRLHSGARSPWISSSLKTHMSWCSHFPI